MMKLRIATLVAVTDVASSQFACSGAYKDTTGTPVCMGASSNTCSSTTCCAAPKKCSNTIVGTGMGICQKDNAASFWDLKKGTSLVAASNSEADKRSACCTATSEAKCSDWLKICPLTHTKVGTNAAPANEGDPKLAITDAEFTSKCCIKTCANVNGLFQANMAKCQAGAAASFNDFKKASSEVESDSEAHVKSACCTATSEAKCSDWLKICPATHTKVGTNAAPANEGDPKLKITDAEFTSKCCVRTCSKTTVGTGMGICRKDSAASFWDLKKGTSLVAESNSEADKRSACCTPTSEAKCSDWGKVCPSGQAQVSTNTAPANEGDIKLKITDAEFTSKCCVTKMKCSAYSADTSGVTSTATSLLAVVVMAVFNKMI